MAKSNYKSIFTHQLNDLWQHREVLYFLFWRDVKVRYKQAALGIAWAVLTPIIQASVFALVFGLFLKIPSGKAPYLATVFTGFIFWNFFSQSLSSSAVSLTGNTNLVTKTAFPKEILVFVSVLARLPDLLAGMGVLLIILIHFHINISLLSLWLLAILLIEIILAIAIGLFFAAANVFFRDINALIPLILMVWMFLTPVVYPLSSVPLRFHQYVGFNPMTGILEGVRQVLLMNQSPNLFALWQSALIACLLLAFSYIFFKKVEGRLADVI